MSTPQTHDFAPKTRALLDAHGDLFLRIAKGSIQHGLSLKKPLTLDLDTLPQEVAAPGACFVTLNKNGRLRGCIGSPEAWQPLATDVAENAFRAAFKDPRFKALTPDETAALDVHLSVLSPAEPFEFSNQADFLQKLRAGKDGLIIEDRGRRALFLPSVWAQLPDPAEFVEHLKAKAGLSAGHWSETFRAWRFIAAETAAKWPDITT